MTQGSPIEPPAWWVLLQRSFGSWLRTPLAVRDGALVAPMMSCDPALRSAVIDDGPGAMARLALYHEQYWARLFVVFQRVFPRVARAVGYWQFNQLVSAHLASRPLDVVDLMDITGDFYPALRAALDALAPDSPPLRHESPLRTLAPAPGDLGAPLSDLDTPWSLLSQALALDEAERRAFRAPFGGIWRPKPSERAALLNCPVRMASGFSLVKTDWALFDVEGPAPRLQASEHIVVFRTESGIASQRVDAVFARLLSLAERMPLSGVFDRIATASPTVAPSAIHALLDGQVDRAIRAGWWVGVRN